MFRPLSNCQNSGGNEPSEDIAMEILPSMAGAAPGSWSPLATTFPEFFGAGSRVLSCCLSTRMDVTKWSLPTLLPKGNLRSVWARIGTSYKAPVL